MIVNIRTYNTRIFKGIWFVLPILIMKIIVSSTIYGQTPVNTFELIETFRFQTTQVDGDPEGGTDVWGWTADDGTEYALMGVYKGIAVVNATTLESITVVPGPSESGSINARDIKTYKHYAYAVSESRGENEGLMVIDLQFLPDSVKFIGSFPIDNVGNVQSHNLSIDTSKGFAYVENNPSNPVSIFDLSDPESPTYVNGFGDRRVHDIYARNDTLYSADPSAGTFTIWDMSDKLSPAIMVRVQIPSAGFVHNIWPTNDGKYVVTTEENPARTVKIWDVSDYGNVSLVSEWLGSNSLAHNALVMGDFVFISHYTAGVYVLDIHDRTNPIEIARYDTYPQTDNVVWPGNWGVYPYTQNGMVFASDVDCKLTILKIRVFTVGVEDEIAELPIEYSLSQAYPNPFNPSTTIEYTLPKSGAVSIVVYDILGQEVARLISNVQQAGEHTVTWDAPNFASGIYLGSAEKQRDAHLIH